MIRKCNTRHVNLNVHTDTDHICVGRFLLEMMMKQDTGVQVNQVNISETVTLPGPGPQQRRKCSC